MANRWILGGLALLMASACAAQPAPPEASKFYKLEFVVKEVESGKVLSARSYSMIASTKAPPAAIRTGAKVPLNGGNYLDVGVNIDARNVMEVEGGIALNVSAEVSTIPSDGLVNGPPTVRQNRWQSDVLLPLKKPTVIFSSDDLNSKRLMQLEVAATPWR